QELLVGVARGPYERCERVRRPDALKIRMAVRRARRLPRRGRRLGRLRTPGDRRLPARKARGLVDAAASLVNRHLRIWAERASAIDSSAGCMRCLDLVRGFAVLDPLLE